jgi:hydrogenase maturation protease
MDRPRVLVLGVGNTLLGDEAAGVRVVEALASRRPWPDGVEFVDGGTLSFTLAGTVAAHDALLVIDAAELGAAPGTVQLFQDDRMDAFLGGNRRQSVHEVSLLDVLAITRVEGLLPARRALIAIQPERIEWSESLSPAVAGAQERVCAIAWELIEDMRGAACGGAARGEDHAGQTRDDR